MMRISRIALGLVGAVAQRLNALACAGMTGESSQDSLPDFTGKVVVVYHAGSRDPYSSSALISPRFERQGGRLFLRGEPAPGDTPNDWALGCRFCVAWEVVEAYLVFDSVEDYQDRCVRFRATRSVQ